MVVKASSRWKKGIKTHPRFEYPHSAKLRELSKAGKKVFNLMDGDPVSAGFSNKLLSECLMQTAKEGWDMYPGSSNYMPKLLQAIVNFEKRKRNIDCTPDDLVLTPGCAAAFNVLHYALLDPGDEIVTPDPSHYLTGPTAYWSYFDANVVVYPSSEEKGWEPDLEALRRSISGKTKGVYLNSPNNPTGAVYDEKMLKGMIDIAGEYDIPLISDEIYSLFTFNEIKAKSVALVAEDVPAIVISGMSKFHMGPGWRLGYLLFHDPQGKIAEVETVVKKLGSCYGHARTGITTPIMVSATRVYEGPTDAGKQMVAELQTRKDFAYKRFNEIEGMSCVEPKGAFYAFPRINEIGKAWKTAIEFAYELILEEGVGVDPGSWYGELGKGHIRTTFLPKIDVLKEAYDKIEIFMARHSS